MRYGNAHFAEGKVYTHLPEDFRFAVVGMRVRVMDIGTTQRKKTKEDKIVMIFSVISTILDVWAG